MKKSNRRSFLKQATGLLSTTLCIPSLLNSQTNKKKNILFIVVDDLRTQLNCYGHTEIKSPNIDELALQGTLFRRAYCQQAVCNPSRASVLTGMRPDTCKIYDLNTHFRDTVPDVITLPQHFKMNEYQTAGFGKIYHSGLNDDPSWSIPSKHVKPKKYADKKTIKELEEKTKKAMAKGLKGKALRRAAKGPAYEMADVPDNDYTDGVTTENAIKCLQNFSKKKQPFFLAVGFAKPHLPFCAPKKYWDMYPLESIKLPDNPNPPKGAPDYAVTTWGELRTYEGIPKSGPVDKKIAKKLIHGYNACVSFADAQVGKVIAELKRLKLYDNTVIMLWGDHGWKLGEHGLWCKHTNFELDANAPLITRAPGYKKSQKSSALIEFVDMYPSLCELAGLSLPKHLEGKSFVPLLKDGNKPWKKAALSQYPRKGTVVMGYSMRTDRYRYTEWLKKGKIEARELYDHEKDPRENINLADKKEVSSLIKELHKILEETRKK